MAPLTSQFTYTWAHGLDDMTAYRGTLPQDSLTSRATTATWTSTLATIHRGDEHDLPNAPLFKPLLNGWELSSLLSFHTGSPFSVFSSNDNSGTGEGEQRADLNGDPYANVSHKFSKSGVTWLNQAALPILGRNIGEQRTQCFYGRYASGTSRRKKHQITEPLAPQFRIENVQPFNRTNLAPPKPHQCSGLGITADNHWRFSMVLRASGRAKPSTCSSR